VDAAALDPCVRNTADGIVHLDLSILPSGEMSTTPTPGHDPCTEYETDTPAGPRKAIIMCLPWVVESKTSGAGPLMGKLEPSVTLAAWQAPASPSNTFLPLMETKS